ncbi:MAG: TadG family pilus assembly protein [Acidobacteriaceae bacterium]|nr:TadG family pilus assembly protein [Acidobacteriaceae bacterium]
MLALMSLTLFAALSVAALSIDAGRVYVAKSQIQSTSNAAALAGALQLPIPSAAITAAQAYGAQMTPTAKCLTTLKNQGMACTSPTTANALQVTQTLVIPMYFARVFGVKQVTISATATAAMTGHRAVPYNVAIIADTTASMNDTDSDTNCSGTRLSCSLAGIQTLLERLTPCNPGLSSCGTSVATTTSSASTIASYNWSSALSIDNVSLFAFPNITAATAPNDWGCSGTNPTAEPYSFPLGPLQTGYVAGSGYTLKAVGSYYPTYQILGYSSDYRVSVSANTLSSTSALSKAVGGASGCAHSMAAPGGEGTYYAGVIYAAQASLVAEYLANYNNYSAYATSPGASGVQNVMIFISDGDADAKSTAMPGASTTTGIYPSTIQQCAQAVTAAQFAAKPTTVGSITVPGTIVYTVAYGSPATGCAADTKTTTTPCATMQNMASDTTNNFYSDYTATGSGGSACSGANQSTTNLSNIFSAIAKRLNSGGARLIDNSTT